MTMRMGQGDLEHRGLVLVDELREGVLITHAQRENELQFVGRPCGSA